MNDRLVKQLDDAQKREAKRRKESKEFNHHLEVLRDDIQQLERAQDARDREIEEVNDLAYLMLQWIKSAVIMFEAKGMEPPEISREFLLFGETYKGRYHNG